MVSEETEPTDVEMEDLNEPSEPLMEAVEMPDQPMEVTSITEVPAEPEPSTADDDPLYGEYLWTLENFSKLGTQKQFSEIFEAGGYYWNLLVFPKGNNGKGAMSVYLNVPDSDTPPGWQRRAKFVLILQNQIDSSKDIKRETDHTFEGKENDWGFTQFVSLHEIMDPSLGFLENDALKLKVKIKVEHPDSYLYNSKRETGFVGLKNQGATCYMNSLLQTLYNINYFRQAVYHMPTSEDEVPSKSIPLALQSLFFKLQFGDHSVNTKNLTQSFGWTTMDAFTQHDVQELNRILSDKLEDKMKGTKVEGTIGKLFEGRIHNFVECINVDYKSTRQEVFADLQLLVKGCKNMYESFDKYVEVENLEGQNQYMAEGHGLQDANKGMLFDSFPPVLQIQLRRFEYDFVRDTMIKINDRYEFPEVLDLDIDNCKYLSENVDRSVRNKYRLHSVLVHSGGINGGHYYAYINPSGSQWLKFDDERVTKEDAKQALDEQYGGQDEPSSGFNAPSYKYTKYSNAYMLVYIRESDWNNIMCEVTKDDLAAHVRERLEKEQAEKERARKEKEESHLYTIIKVARDSDLRAQIGHDKFFDLVDHDKVASFRVKKHDRFREFRQHIAGEWGIPPERQFWWGWEARNNHTYRPQTRLSEVEDTMKVIDIKEKSQGNSKPWPPRLHLFLQEPPNEETFKELMRPAGRMDSRLLFLKRYFPKEQRLEYVGNLTAPKTSTFRQVLPLMLHMSGMPGDAEIDIWEEVKFHDVLMINPIRQECTLDGEQVSDGDILLLQERLTQEEAESIAYPTPQQFLDYVRNRKMVNFRKLEDPKEDGFELELSVENRYDDVEAAVAKHLGLDNQRMLRFTGHNHYSGVPKPNPFSWRGVNTLPEMLSYYGSQVSNTLYYEVLDLPLPELEQLKTVRVSWHNAKGEQVTEHRVRVSKDAKVADLLEALREKEAEAAGAQELRLMDILHSKIYKIYEPDEGVEGINDAYWTMRAEAVPEDEFDVPDGDRVIYLCHVSVNEGKHVTVFGDPICMRVGEEETMGALAKRIQARLGVTDEEFGKWKFCHVKGISSSSAEWLNPDDVVTQRFTRQSGLYGSGGEQPYLGLHHTITYSKRQQNRSNNVYERAIKIYS